MHMKRFLTQAFLFLVAILGGNACSDVAEPQPETDPEIRGADLSFLPEIRQSGQTFYNALGQPEDMLHTLKNAGANVIRLRLWKKPASPTSGLVHVKQLAQEIHEAGLQVLLSVHYSDTWADPAHQTMPAQWENIPFTALQDSVYQYTKHIMAEIKPDYIQIGNEINHGFLWPQGDYQHPEQQKALLRQGISAVRAAQIKTKIILHYAGTDGADYFLNQVRDLDYDVIGLSFYPIWHGKDLDLMRQQLTTLLDQFQKPVLIVETSYPFSLGWNDWTNNVLGRSNQLLPNDPATPQGQRDYLMKIAEIMRALPNGLGFCYWGGEWVSYKGNQSTDGSSWENQALWDFENKAVPALEAFQKPML